MNEWMDLGVRKGWLSSGKDKSSSNLEASSITCKQDYNLFLCGFMLQ